MTEADLQLLKTSVGKHVRIVTSDGEEVVAKVISVFDRESDPDIFYEVVSTTRPHLYAKREGVGGYSLPLSDIVSVEPAA